MNHMKPADKKKISSVQIIRAVIQLIAFIAIPGLFITVFSAIGSIYTAIIGGTFVFSEQLGNILLTVAVLLVTALWGRFFCGFICSFGAMQDLLRFLGKRITRKQIVPEKADKVLKHLKYAVLLYIVIGVWTFGLGADTVWSPWTVFGMYASPWNGLPSHLAFLSVGGILLLAIIVGSLFIDRFFCKYLCPLGAIFTPLARLKVFRIKKPSAMCGSCRRCTKNCPMALPLYRYDEVKSGECINCLKCTAVCHRDNVSASAIPAVSGTIAAAAIAGVTFMGTLPTADIPAMASEPTAVISTEAAGKYKNGIYPGSASGYRGMTEVSVKVESGYISEITIVSSGDDREFLSKAENQVIPEIIEQQDTDVAAVSGATFSSRGIINAVKDALNTELTAMTEAATEAMTQTPTQAPTEAPTEEPTEEITYGENDDSNNYSGSFADGVYYGSGSGYRGTTNAVVTVEGGVITDITVTSYQDDDRFFNSAQYGVISAILNSQSVDVDTVSGATFSSNSIKEAVADALGLSFSNPNSSMSRTHGGKGHW